MKLLFKNYIYESQQAKIKYIEPGTELFHGTGESINGNLDIGDTDKILWLADNTEIAQSYIHCSLKTMIYSKSLISPLNKKESTLAKIQKQLGIIFNIESYDSNGNPIKYSIVKPDSFNSSYENDKKTYETKLKPLSDEIKTTKHELDKVNAEIVKYLKDKTYKVNTQELDSKYMNLSAKLEELNKKYSEIQSSNPEPTQNKIKYVDNKLKEYGYTGDYQNKYDGSIYNLYLDEDDNLLPYDHQDMGKLYIVKPKRRLKFLDVSSGISDEDYLLYNDLELLRRTEKQGYDGIIIDDIAQHDKLGNVPHISYGVFKKTIPDLEIESIDACHPKEIRDEPTSEYSKYKASK